MKKGDPAMDAVSYQDYVNILKEELVPAMGCTCLLYTSRCV